MPVQQPCFSDQPVLAFDSCSPIGLMVRYALTSGLSGALRWIDRVYITDGRVPMAWRQMSIILRKTSGSTASRCPVAMPVIVRVSSA